MKKKLLLFLYFICYYVGLIHLFYWINRKKQRILVFHHIIPDEYITENFEQNIVCTSYSKFKWLMSIVNKRLRVTTELGFQGSAIITFDDGYRAALIADKVLDTWNNKAYFFIPLSNVGGGPLWIDQIMAWFAYVPVGTYKINGSVVELNDDLSRQKAFSGIVDRLYEDYDKENIMKELGFLYPYGKLQIDAEYWELRFKGLTKEEIDLLKKKGHKIGAHSINHDILSSLDEKQIQDDFSKCSLQVGYLFNTDLYAYPFGHKRDVNSNVLQICSKSSFTYAVFNEYNPSSSDISLSRQNISHYESRYEVEAALSGLIQTVKNILK